MSGNEDEREKRASLLICSLFIERKKYRIVWKAVSLCVWVCGASTVVVFQMYLVYIFYSFSLCHIFLTAFTQSISKCILWCVFVCICYVFFLRNLPTFLSEYYIRCAMPERNEKACKKMRIWSIQLKCVCFLSSILPPFVLFILFFLNKINNDYVLLYQQNNIYGFFLHSISIAHNVKPKSIYGFCIELKKKNYFMLLI